jgi:hypothetical protein
MATSPQSGRSPDRGRPWANDRSPAAVESPITAESRPNHGRITAESNHSRITAESRPNRITAESRPNRITAEFGRITHRGRISYSLRLPTGIGRARLRGQTEAGPALAALEAEGVEALLEELAVEHLRERERERGREGGRGGGWG